MGIGIADGQLLEDAVEIATKAGRATLGWFQSRGLEVETKSDGSPVTEADKSAERLIRDELDTRYPHDGIVGEEEGIAVGTSGRTWTIDPIDGTQAFVRGVPLYSTLLAVEDAESVIAGVIFLPALGETVSGGRGLGCFHDGNPTKVSAVEDLDEFVLSTSGYGYMPNDMVNRLHASSMRLRTWGDGYGYALVATGRIEAMADPIVHVWDLAPLMVIIPEAGGTFTDFEGTFTHRSGNGLATNGTAHAQVLEIVTGR